MNGGVDSHSTDKDCSRTMRVLTLIDHPVVRPARPRGAGYFGAIFARMRPGCSR